MRSLEASYYLSTGLQDVIETLCQAMVSRLRRQ